MGVPFLLIALAIAWLWIADPMGDRGSNNAFTFMLVGLAVILWMLWFLLFSGQRWWVRLLPPGILVGLVLLLTSLFRFDFVSGDFIPQFSLRSSTPAGAGLGVEPARPAGGTADLSAVSPEDFPQFLGPERRAAVEGVDLARDWQAQPPERLWRQKIGAGWSGFAVVGGYAVTQEQRGDQELVTCYDAETGKLVWSQSLAYRYESPVAGVGPRATPTIAGGVVYAQGAGGLLSALDGATGALLWSTDLREVTGMSPEIEARELPYGRSGSPLVVDDLVIVPGGGPEEGSWVSLLAFDRHSGEEVWRGGSDQISCSSPAVATLLGRRQVLSVNESTVTGHDLATGEVLWTHPWPGDTAANCSVSQPMALPPDRVFLSKGYGVGAALVELSPAAGGSEPFATQELWHQNRSLRTKFTNATIFEGHAYGLSDGILECVALAGGERCWKNGRYRQGQLVRAGNLLLVLSEEGEMFLVEATPERPNHVLGSFEALAGKTWNTFALAGDRLLVRNAEQAAAYRLPLAP